MFLEMELAQGSVRDYLQMWGQSFAKSTRAFVPPGLANAWLANICNGLRKLHALEIAHRDVKPDNMLVRFDGALRPVVKLLDFSLEAEEVAARRWTIPLRPCWDVLR